MNTTNTNTNSLSATNTNMSIIDYCNTNGIQWQPVQLVQKRPTMCFGVLPKSNDFYGSTMLSDEEFAKRKSNVAKYQHIWISTMEVQQIDVDDPEYDHSGLTEDMPYYESVSKKLPHVFVHLNNKELYGKRECLSNNDKLEMLNGQGAYCLANAVVYNADSPIQPVSDEILKGYREATATPPSLPPPVYTENDNDMVTELLQMINPARADDYAEWTRIGMCLKCLDLHNVKLWIEWSKQSPKFDNEAACVAKWATFSNTGMSLGSLRFLARTDNPEQYAEFTESECLTEYEKIKMEVEERVFKVKYTAEFCIETENGALVRLNRSNIKTAYEELEFTEMVWNKELMEKVPVKKCFMETWFKDPVKRMYNSIDFLPTPLESPPNVYNTWKGFEIERDGYYIDRKPENCDKIFQLIKVLCNNNDDAYEYVLDWLAQMLQSPAVKPGTAVVLKSKQGAGKGTLVEIMRKIMGNAYVGESSNPVQDVFGPHGNAHIGKILLSFDEIGSGDTNKVLGRLKNLITSHRCTYNEKGVKQVEVNNCCRFLFTTNKSIPISIDGKEDRRYCLIESSNEYCKDTVFWKDFYKNVMDNENVLYGFYKALMNRNTTERDWMLMPDTELRNDIIQASQHPIVFFVDRLIRQMETKTKKYTASDLFNAYKEDCSGNGINFSGNCKSFGIMFKDKVPFEQCGVVKGRSRTSMFYEIDRDIMYEWLSDNNYTAFDCLPSTNELTTGTSFF